MISPVMPVYRRSDLLMVRGEGAYLFDETGKRYLDFAAGIAVNALGHTHPHVTAALKKQADLLWHCSNLYRNHGLEKLAQRLVDHTFADTVFFCSSGAEAVECAIKIARRYQYTRGEAARNRIITFTGGYHGRTYVGISAGSSKGAQVGYAPLLPGFDQACYNDLASVEALINHETAGVILEAVQGEGGVHAASTPFLQGLRALVDKHGLVLILDEVQCGMGRTGRLFAFEEAGITPDIVTVAKGIGNGFPLAATLATEKAAACMTPGSHGSTYGANPLAMAVGNAVLDVMLEGGFLAQVKETAAYASVQLNEVAKRWPGHIEAIAGRGLMIGLRMRIPHYEFAARLRENGLLTAPCAGDSVIRLLPPLIITHAHVDEACAMLHDACKEWTI